MVGKRGEITLFKLLLFRFSRSNVFMVSNDLLQLEYLKMILNRRMGLLLGSNDGLIHEYYWFGSCYLLASLFERG
jgi:hypothetical protein